MNSFDLSIFNFLHGIADRWFLLDWLAIFFAVYLGYLMTAFFVVMVIKEKDRKKRAYAFAWWVLAAIISRGIVAEVIYFFYQRLRPFVALNIEPVFNHAATPSFPSAHMAFYATLIIPMWYLDRKWGILYAASISGMAVARIYGAVHWPLDIIGGIVIALGATYGVRYMLFREVALHTEVEVIKEETIK
ncbi:MAG: PAP2 (Type 2 phosphatidic acid phosphatase) family protein [Candidatus Wolfebacteria bacterium GW2011_GWE1_48_7]|uniref:PAP2 (Type 2 phosphatidic acid phosphatase) family protein n=2 Tax=Candidatus Wolfeibacteriota TaxID=1752735 RepID=A0A0G1WFN1_9BACT|nr:MAG: membrane-associated phospholipid phosphatase [Candidatus Wolfebacteria bacterium GW2011_GWB1_47_1]KKU42170.1 MAG: PAP2 (Type 2 phosphatidic acid phosphatase) family protein [Candidatus Wolfebacteria bacterium GW2011_GWB2_46_69]KKU54054.1 MAG: PAP2 (Type 2 phosphatidic acid phosphatase) family protein [Candidatus Wolfebacteria bacterium GW2011_GWC1_47_103]KKU59241.1 MAG: PAP2 (Type 2 phosphatidic acid phosphatase) family protein [Candidatus Wolfebacteria bacterium GW2011_GWE2_47_12]KKU65